MVSSHAATEAATAAPLHSVHADATREAARAVDVLFRQTAAELTLVATMLHSIRHGRPFKPAEWSTRRLRPKCGRYSQNILLPPQCTVSVTTPDGALLALAQSNRTRPIRCAKPLEPKSPRVSGMGLDFAETVRPRTAPPGSFHF